jgi:hypothetical protein
MALSEAGRMLRGRDGGGDLTNVQCEPMWNCHNEFPLHNKYIWIKKKFRNQKGNNTEFDFFLLYKIVSYSIHLFSLNNTCLGESGRTHIIALHLLFTGWNPQLVNSPLTAYSGCFHFLLVWMSLLWAFPPPTHGAPCPPTRRTAGQMLSLPLPARSRLLPQAEKWMQVPSHPHLGYTWRGPREVRERSRRGHHLFFQHRGKVSLQKKFILVT